MIIFLFPELEDRRSGKRWNPSYWYSGGQYLQGKQTLRPTKVVGEKWTSFNFTCSISDEVMFLGLAVFIPYDLIK